MNGDNSNKLGTTYKPQPSNAIHWHNLPLKSKRPILFVLTFALNKEFHTYCKFCRYIHGVYLIALNACVHARKYLLKLILTVCVLTVWIQALEDYHKLRKPSNGSAEQFTSGNAIEMPEFRVLITRKFEISELCEIFICKWSKYVYLVLLTLLTFFACISYSTVAGSSWSEILPFSSHHLLECNISEFNDIIPPTHDCRNAYRLCLFFFACIVVPLSLLELREQVWVQVVLGLMRFFTIGCIIIYCVVKLITDFPFANCMDENRTNSTGEPQCVGEALTRFEGKQWLFAVPVFVYASILHQGVPSLTHPVKQKKWLRAYFNCLYIVIVSLYTFLGVTVSLWFNSSISGLCTLNWVSLNHVMTTVAIRTVVRIAYPCSLLTGW